MTISIVNSQRKCNSKGAKFDRFGRASYVVSWEHDINSPGVANVSGVSEGLVFELAKLLSGAARCPLEGEDYFFDGIEDLTSYCQGHEVTIIHGTERETRFRLDAMFEPLQPNVTSAVLSELDPLSFPVVFDVDYLEEQVPLESAKIVENLTHIGRPANSVGPIVNSCGDEFTDPLLKDAHSYILLARKNFATIDDIEALNDAFQDTVNSTTFRGRPARTMKFLRCESGGQQKARNTTFYPGTIKIHYKKATWDRRPLNNGWNHFEKTTAGAYVKQSGKPQLFPNMLQKVKATFTGDIASTEAPTEHCSEPLNLDIDGTLLGHDQLAKFLTYRDLNEVAYSGIGIGS